MHSIGEHFTPSKPVNKQAAMFMSRKRRAETVQDAMDFVATRISNPEFVEDIKGTLEAVDDNTMAEVQLVIRVRRDQKTTGALSVGLNQYLCHEGQRSTYYGLE